MKYLILVGVFFFFFKQKTAYEMRISDWSSDVCSSDLAYGDTGDGRLDGHARIHQRQRGGADGRLRGGTVGGQHVRHETERVRELGERRKHRLDRDRKRVV